MNQPRVDMFRPIHKGLRAQLFATAAAAARTDFTDDDEAPALLQRIARLLAMMTEHAHHEDMMVFSVLATLDRPLAERLAGDHAALDQVQFELGALVAQAEGADAAGRRAMAAPITSLLNRLVALHLQHMDREEREAEPVFLENCTDAELVAIRGRITASMTPDRGLEMLAIMLPALSRPERSALVAGIVASGPPALAAKVAELAAGPAAL